MYLADSANQELRCTKTCAFYFAVIGYICQASWEPFRFIFSLDRRCFFLSLSIPCSPLASHLLYLCSFLLCILSENVSYPLVLTIAWYWHSLSPIYLHHNVLQFIRFICYIVLMHWIYRNKSETKYIYSHNSQMQKWKVEEKNWNNP